MTWNAGNVWHASDRFPGTCSRCGQPKASHFMDQIYCFEPPAESSAPKGDATVLVPAHDVPFNEQLVGETVARVYKAASRFPGITTPPPGQWLCSGCGYFNGGPICTKCGKSVCISTTCPACGNGFIATDESPEFGVHERDERLAMERVIDLASQLNCCAGEDAERTPEMQEALEALAAVRAR